MSQIHYWTNTRTKAFFYQDLIFHFNNRLHRNCCDKMIDTLNSIFGSTAFVENDCCQMLLWDAYTSLLAVWTTLLLQTASIEPDLKGAFFQLPFLDPSTCVQWDWFEIWTHCWPQSNPAFSVEPFLDTRGCKTTPKHSPCLTVRTVLMWSTKKLQFGLICPQDISPEWFSLVRVCFGKI